MNIHVLYLNLEDRRNKEWEVGKGVSLIQSSASVSMHMARSRSSLCSAQETSALTTPFETSLCPPGTSMNARTNFKACSRSTFDLASEVECSFASVLHVHS